MRRIEFSQESGLQANMVTGKMYKIWNILQDDLPEKNRKWRVLWGNVEQVWGRKLMKVADWLRKIRWLEEREPGGQTHAYTLKRRNQTGP